MSAETIHILDDDDEFASKPFIYVFLRFADTCVCVVVTLFETDYE